MARADDFIGYFAARRGTKWHLCESVIAHDVITRCGRRMRDEPTSRGELLFRKGPSQSPADCRQCLA